MVQLSERFEVEPPIQRGRNWPALIASAVFHLAILLLLLYGIPSAAGPVKPIPAGARTPEPVVFAMPRPRREAPQLPPQRPRPPAPPLKEQILGPDARKPADVPKQAASTSAPDQTPAQQAQPRQPAQPQQAQPAAPPPTAPQQAPTASTSPLRIPQPGDYLGGRGIVAPTPSPFPPPSISSSAPAATPSATPLGMGRLGMANTSREQFENSFDDETQGKCVDVPDLGKNPDGTPVLAAVTGVVYDNDGTTPLPNAHLQIIGYPYATFSDANGNYRLEFDPSTLAHCRSQYVVVEAAGHRSQTLMLAVGPNVVSPPIVMKRR